jgi:hypothetical protein
VKMPGIADLFHVAIKTNNLLDHATGFHGFIERFKKGGLDWRNSRPAKPGSGSCLLMIQAVFCLRSHV